MTSQELKAKLLEELYKPYKNCMKCPLATQGRTTVVFGEGDPDASLMIIGEGPGKDEDLLGRPFVGRSGKLLNKALEACGKKRDSLFITNIVKCRPPENRNPTAAESTTCVQLLLKKEIEIVQPGVICTLGSTALEYLTEKEIKISKNRGKIIQKANLAIFPTYHPAFIMRNPKLLSVFVLDLQEAINLAQKLKPR